LHASDKATVVVAQSGIFSMVCCLRQNPTTSLVLFFMAAAPPLIDLFEQGFDVPANGPWMNAQDFGNAGPRTPVNHGVGSQQFGHPPTALLLKELPTTIVATATAHTLVHNVVSGGRRPVSCARINLKSNTMRLAGLARSRSPANGGG
jgi:hypothetical protein